jgi:hypothetical protein
MLSNVVLASVLVVFVAFHFLMERSHRIETKRLIDAVIAKNTQEFVTIQKQENPAPKEQRPEPERIFAEGL